MPLINIDAIIIPPDRQRRDFDEAALSDLADSISSIGLMQPIVLRDDRRTIVAGERRMRAIRDFLHALSREYSFQGESVPCGYVPYVTLGSLDPIALEEAELDENLKRVDLTWQERTAAVLRLDQLRAKQASTRGVAHNVAALALELTGRNDGYFHEAVRQDLIVAKHLGDPAVAGAKTAAEAFKILRKQEEASRNVALAKAVGKTFSAQDHEVYNTDCLEFLDRDEYTGKFDCIITDPPYGMGADTFNNAAGKLTGTNHVYDDSATSFERLMREWMPLSFDVAKPQAHLYLFCDIDKFHFLRAGLEDAGWTVHRTPLVYHKINSGRVPWPEYGPRRSYELILYAVKGKRPVTAILPDVIEAKGDEQLGHGAQKAVSAYEQLLMRSCRPGDIVLDPFAGTGTVFPAAHGLKIRAVGIEKEEAAFGICLNRLKGLS